VSHGQIIPKDDQFTNESISRDRVIETVTQSKILPPEMSSQRLGNVNLFMRAIGLDVKMLG
jgi:hypothetical protein